MVRTKHDMPWDVPFLKRKKGKAVDSTALTAVTLTRRSAVFTGTAGYATKLLYYSLREETFFYIKE
jgi:hypothetical protein